MVKYSIKSRIFTIILCCILIASGSLIIITNFKIVQNDIYNNQDLPDNGLSPTVKRNDLKKFNGPPNQNTRALGRGTPDDEDSEPNDDMNNATRLNIPVGLGNNIWFKGDFSPSDTEDWYRFDASKGDASGNNADRILIDLTANNNTNGVKMELYAPKPYPHRLGTSIVHVSGSPSSPLSSFDMMAPLNGTYFLKVMPNDMPSSSKEEYFLNYVFLNIHNSAYNGINNFSSSERVYPSKENVKISNRYLDPVFNVHDFYIFTGYVNQSIEIILTLDDGADYDLFLFDKKSTQDFKNSTKRQFGGEEKIVATLKEDTEYYVRVWAKIDGDINHLNNNASRYELEFKGNVPPTWQDGKKDYYSMEEDADPIFIEPEIIWKDYDKNDDIEYFIWNETIQDWAERKDNIEIISDVSYDNLRLQIINNDTMPSYDETIKIISLKDKYGVTEVKLGARDVPPNTYSAHNITVNITPLNDPPIINNIQKWNRFQPDELTLIKNRIIVKEENTVKIQVTAFDIEGDNLTFFDNTGIFDIDPYSGWISFNAPYTLIGKYDVNITVIDDGINPEKLSDTITVTFEIEGYIDHSPKTYLHFPENNSYIKSLSPTLIWNVSDVDSDPNKITYNLYLSAEQEKVLSHSKEAMVCNGTNLTKFKITTALEDQFTYYWTVVPFDGLFTGRCVYSCYKFKIDTAAISPSVILVSPANQSILNYTDIELKWNIQYNGDQQVISDIYVGISEIELELKKKDYDGDSYSPDDIINDHVYYWKVLPKAGKPPNRISGEESLIYSFSIHKNYKPPTVQLISPADRSIFKIDEVSLSWSVNYKKPERVGYEVYLSTSKEFDNTPYKTVDGATFLKLNGLSIHRDYYWKVVPFIGSNPGPESEVREFKIDTNAVQPIVIPIYPRNNQILNDTHVEFKWNIEYSGQIANVRYDVYLDNSTDYLPALKQIKNNYRQLFLGIQLENLKIYHWYVLPSIEIEDGLIVGEFRGNVSRFEINTSFHPPPEPEFELTLEHTFLEMQPGNTTSVGIFLRNTGNIELSIDISYEEEPSDLLLITLETKRILLNQGASREILLEITAPSNIKPKTDVTIRIQCLADGTGLVDREVLNIKIKNDGDSNAKQNQNFGSLWIVSIIGIIIVGIILLFLFVIVPRSRRKHVKAEETEKVAKTAERVPIPSSSPYASPVIEVPSYKPPPSLAQLVPSSETTKPTDAPLKPVEFDTKIKPGAPVTAKSVRPAASVTAKPVRPAASVTAKPVKPAASVAAKARTSSPTATPVKAKSASPISEPATAKPVKPKH